MSGRNNTHYLPFGLEENETYNDYASELTASYSSFATQRASPSRHADSSLQVPVPYQSSDYGTSSPLHHLLSTLQPSEPTHQPQAQAPGEQIATLPSDDDYYSEYTINSPGSDGELPHPGFRFPSLSRTLMLTSPPLRMPIALIKSTSPTMPNHSYRKRSVTQVDIEGGPSTSAKRRRLSSTSAAKGCPRSSQKESKPIEEIDLAGDDDTIVLTLQKQRAEQVASQQSQCMKGTKLSGLTCTICLDSPTDLTATACGLFARILL